MPKVTLKGKGLISLSDAKDFKAQGGEANLYVQGNTMFKLWHDPKQLPPMAKIAELRALSSDPNFIIPENVILDEKSAKPVGVTMRYVDKAFVLCQLFPKAFRDRMKLSSGEVLHLVERIRKGMEFAHTKDILIVDLNEMNLLASEDFKSIYFIDTTTYQTKSFPATALMESVRDRHQKGFSKESDYFAFAVVSFNLFIGIHPYRGKCDTLDQTVPKDMRMDARMKNNISVFHDGVRVPGACLPFSVMPPIYKDWYRAVFEEGKRAAPPSDLHAIIEPVATPATKVSGSQQFDITLYFEYDDEVASFYEDVVITRKSVYANNRVVARSVPGSHISITPKLSHPVIGRLDGGHVVMFDAYQGAYLTGFAFQADALMSSAGRLYIHGGESLFEITYLERMDGSPVIPSLTRVANVMPHSTQLFEGVAIQYMLKSYYAVLVPETGKSYQVRLSEVEGYKVVEAKFSKRVLMIIGTRLGKYVKFIYRFSAEYSFHNHSRVEDISYTGLNFTVRDDGLTLHLNHEEELEVFKNRADSSATIRPLEHVVFTDSGIPGDARLTHMGTQSMFFQGSRMYRFSSKKR